MARTVLTVQTLGAFGGTTDGVTWTVGNADGHEFTNDGRTVVLIKNLAAAIQTGTIKGIASSRTFQRTGDVTMAVPDGTGATNEAVGMSNCLPRGAFNKSNGKVDLDLSAVVTLWVAAVSLTPTPQS
jgi:hypothetical protein